MPYSDETMQQAMKVAALREIRLANVGITETQEEVNREHEELTREEQKLAEMVKAER